eukprot:NODE_20_length_44879_cov_0.624654.p15 type:complete len:311 gc:universal NODE_20_length_44879_cov_0.624654:30293-29361(-)
MIALFLSVRPDLTWRDVQHVVLLSARPFEAAIDDWQVVAKNRKFSHTFGYGLLDASAMVDIAKTWKLVNRETQFKSPIIAVNQNFGDNEELSSIYNITQENLSSVNFGDLEHVTVTLTIEHQRRGDLEITLISPSKITSFLAKPRPGDYHSDTLKDWTMSTVVHFDDIKIGSWTIKVKDSNSNKKTGKFVQWQLTLMGASLEGNKTNVITNTTKPQNSTTTIPDTDNNQKPNPSLEDKGGFGTLLAVLTVLGFLGFGIYYFKGVKSHHRLKEDDNEETEILHDANEFFEDDFELQSISHSSPPRKYVEKL